MGIKSFFQGIGRGISRGFKKFVSGAGDAIGGAATFLQRKAIPAIASGANQAASVLGKISPLLDAAGPEAAAAGAEAADVASKVGAGVGQFAKFIGSDIADKPPVVANAQQILAFSQSPFGMAIRRSQGLTSPLTAADAASMAAGVKPTPVMPVAPATPLQKMMTAMPKGLISPAPNPLKVVGSAIKPLIGSNSATYTPSSIEAQSATPQPNIKVVGAAPTGMLSM
jgi:hypothetical protein